MNRLFLVIIGFLLAGEAFAEHFVRLKTGQIVRCAVLKQDTTSVITTDWELRGLALPPVQVFELNEVESIWFEPPKDFKRISYHPLPGRLSFGGGLALQTSDEWNLPRRSLVCLSLLAGVTILPQLSFECDGDVSVPIRGRSDSLWNELDVGYRVSFNVVGHPVSSRGFVPFALIGGGMATQVPQGSLLLSNKARWHDLFNVGLGVKWGRDGFGYRIEWRHNLLYRSSMAPVGNLSILRASLFVYR